MALKPVPTLKQGETFQHYTGKLDKQISRKTLEQNPKMYRTHPQLFENVAALKRDDAMQGRVTGANKSQVVRVFNAKNAQTGATSILIAAAPKKSANDNKLAARGLLEKLVTANSRSIAPVQKEAAKSTEKTEKGKKNEVK